ncbi:low temperature requirement protein LtrA [Aeromicrobium panaciterrae]|uniref:Low temperature requirement protein LtrA n=1 Tax=Aeromicrobium panaciterrae TaxID=363861 RepID=A0ABU1UKM6_9ACTN|nr:low temperature requirement protein A [Aeromicrobium panaciterrae]MDR7085746.1 low temperature requirement protein LtrA [Aeromicrobium panaciterrae]
MIRPLIRPLAPRDPHEEHRTASPLELFTDLCYVVAIAQGALTLEHEIAAGHPAHGLIWFSVSFFAIFWAWLNFVWFNSAYDSDDTISRLLTLLQIFGSLVLAAGVPKIFEEDFTLGIIGYVIMRIGLVLMWLRASAGHPERRRTALRYAYGLIAVQAGWVAALLVTGGHLPLWLFIVGVALDFGVPFYAELAGTTPWHPHHIAERYGLMFIIVLGEMILSVTLALRVAFDEKDPPMELWFVVAGGVLVTFCAWWLYFSRDNSSILTGNDVGYVWGFGHYVIFGSAAAIGAGLAVRIAYYGDHAEVSDLVSSAFVTGPVAAFLLMLWVICVRLHDPSLRTAIPFVAAVIALVAVTFVPYSELWAGVIFVILLVAVLRRTPVSASA